MSKMILFGGEKDGLEVPVLPSKRPDVFYAVPNLDDEKIRKIKGDRAKVELREKLAILAYQYDAEQSTRTHFKMMRRPDLDRVRQT